MFRRSFSRFSAWRALLACAVAFAWILAYAFSSGTAVTSRIEAQTLDWRYKLRGPIVPNDSIVLVVIDDRSAEAVGGWPVSRRQLARTVERLGSAGASVIVLDLLLLDTKGDRAATRALAEAIARAGRVVIPFAFSFEPQQSPELGIAPEIAAAAYPVYRLPPGQSLELLPHPRGALLPDPTLAAAAASVGHVNVLLDDDGALRHENTVIRYGEALFPSLAIETVRLFWKVPRQAVTVELGSGLQFREHFIATEAHLRLTVNHLGPQGTFPTVSLADLLEGRIPADYLEKRIVLLGTDATGAGEAFVTPFSRRLPGLEHHATVIDNVLNDRSLRRDYRTLAVDLGGIFLGSLAAALAVSSLLFWLSFGAVLSLLAGWCAIAWAGFALANQWFNMVYPLAAITSTALLFGALRSGNVRQWLRHAQQERRNLARYVPAGLADSLARSDSPTAHDRMQHAAVVFVDIVGFTRLSEQMTPPETMRLLRAYHERAERAIDAFGGTVDKFQGDGVMASFGLTNPSPTDACDALAAACRLAEDMEAWNKEREREGQPPVRIGIGVHYGPVMVGNLGSAQHLQFTVSGDAVNVASRLEALTRSHNATVIASDVTMEMARSAGGEGILGGFTLLPPQEIRGRTQPIGIWAWSGPKEATEPWGHS